jgi:hypothetical protein
VQCFEGLNGCIVTISVRCVQCNRIGSRFGDEAIASALQSRDALTVTLVDSPGFENTAVNSLEQFCANYAYEKLEQLFCTVVFKREVRHDVHRDPVVCWHYVPWIRSRCIALRVLHSRSLPFILTT